MSHIRNQPIFSPSEFNHPASQLQLADYACRVTHKRADRSVTQLCITCGRGTRQETENVSVYQRLLRSGYSVGVSIHCSVLYAGY
jgi:hypothetical protein